VVAPFELGINGADSADEEGVKVSEPSSITESGFFPFESDIIIWPTKEGSCVPKQVSIMNKSEFLFKVKRLDSVCSRPPPSFIKVKSAKKKFLPFDSEHSVKGPNPSRQFHGSLFIFFFYEIHIFPRQMYFVSTYSSMPYFDPSLPRPEDLIPPNGATSVEMIPSLTPTIPTSIASENLKIRPRSFVKR
jgi:hypothetical protein